MFVMRICGCFEGVDSVGQFSDFDRAEMVCPSFKVVCIVSYIPGSGTGNLQEQFGTEFRVLISRWGIALWC